ncbi:MAG: CoA-disulfide reductase [Candidatus Nezhaarchaeales archaeon]
MLKVVVVGGNAAGMSAASRAKRLKPDLNVIVFERGNYVSYGPCGIPYYVSGVVGRLEDLIHEPLETFVRERGIDVKIRCEVVDIDTSGKSVTIIDRDSGRENIVEYDKLVLATGGKPLVPRIDGVELEGVYTLRRLEDANELMKGLLKAEKVVIVGGGYIGVEMAEAITKLGKKVTVLEMMPYILPNFDSDVSQCVERELKAHGVEVRTGEKVIELKGKDSVSKVVTEKESYDADMVLLAVGVKPNVDLAMKAGINLGITGAIKVNERMQTSKEDIYAAGDNTETINIVTGKPTYNPLAPTANKMGRVAGTNVAGFQAVFKGVVGSAVLKVFNIEAGRTGLSSKEAEREGFNVASATIESITKSKYCPGVKKIKIKLIADADTGRLLGAQIIGEEGVSGRINTLATALMSDMNVYDVAMLDLAYHPYFGPVWDPIIVAASVVLRQIKVRRV